MISEIAIGTEISVPCTVEVFGNPKPVQGGGEIRQCWYRPASCALKTCFGLDNSDPAVCSGQGTCIDGDQCQCNSGWTVSPDWISCADEWGVQ